MQDRFSDLKVIENNLSLYLELGDCPNIEFPTNGGGLLWKNSKQKNGWKLQYNYLTGLSRILDENNIRKAWGSPVVMEEKFKRLTRADFLEPGDVVGVVRKKALNMYEHYAVYIGENKVVHYSGNGADFGGSVLVQIDSLKNFLKEDDDYFVLLFDKAFVAPRKIQVRTSFNLNDVNYENILFLGEKKKWKIYSSQETVERALSKVGEAKYDLVLNNCEHFAIWCKTGVSESYQVKRVVKRVFLNVFQNPIKRKE